MVNEQLQQNTATAEPAEGSIGVFRLPFERLRQGAVLDFGVNCLHAGGRCFYYRPSRNTRAFENHLPETGEAILIAGRKNNHGQYILRWAKPGQHGLRVLYREPRAVNQPQTAMYLAATCFALAAAACLGLFLYAFDELLSASSVLALTAVLLYAVGRFALRGKNTRELVFDELWELGRKGRPLDYPLIEQTLPASEIQPASREAAVTSLREVAARCASLSVTEGRATDTHESHRLGAFGSWRGKIPWLLQVMPPKFVWAFRTSKTLFCMFSSCPNGLPEDWDAERVPPCLVDEDRIIAIHNPDGVLYGLVNLEDMRAYTGKVLEVSSATLAGATLCAMAVALVALWNVLEIAVYGWHHFWETSGVDLLLLFGGLLVFLVMLACFTRDALVAYIAARPRDARKKEHQRTAIEAIRAFNVASQVQARIEP